MTEFIKVSMINGVETYINSDVIVRVDKLDKYLAVYFIDESVLKIDKKCLKFLFN